MKTTQGFEVLGQEIANHIVSKQYNVISCLGNKKSKQPASALKQAVSENWDSKNFNEVDCLGIEEPEQATMVKTTRHHITGEAITTDRDILDRVQAMMNQFGIFTYISHLIVDGRMIIFGLDQNHDWTVRVETRHHSAFGANMPEEYLVERKCISDKSRLFESFQDLKKARAKYEWECLTADPFSAFISDITRLCANSEAEVYNAANELLTA